MPNAILVLLTLAMLLYCVVVVWNPDLKYLLAGVCGPNGVVQTCGVDMSTYLMDTSLHTRVDAGLYYSEYHSHRLEHLSRVRNILVASGCRRFVYFCGDSTLDNKHWLFKPFKDKQSQMFDPTFTAEALNGYEHALHPSRMVQDVSYWMNKEASERLGPGQLCTLMTSLICFHCSKVGSMLIFERKKAEKHTHINGQSPTCCHKTKNQGRKNCSTTHPVGLCAQACSKMMLPSGMALISWTKPSKSKSDFFAS